MIHKPELIFKCKLCIFGIDSGSTAHNGCQRSSGIGDKTRQDHQTKPLHYRPSDFKQLNS